MKDLPYFLALVKKNLILYTIITSNSFANIDFKGYETDVWNERYMEIKNFKLGPEDAFSDVNIGFSNLGLQITFKTSNSKYFDFPKKYFNRDSPIRVRNYEMAELKVNSNSIRLGEYDYFKPPVDVSLTKSTAYGYSISLWFIDREALNKIPID